MRRVAFLVVGILFGIVMFKSEAISWYRIQEMFLFKSFHMYGIIGTTVLIGVIMHQILKRNNIKGFNKESLQFPDKPLTYKASIIGGTIFGLGWAITGACPGPIYVLIGAGNWAFIIVLISALIGAIFYGILKSKLPH